MKGDGERGRGVARVLRGAWRARPPACGVSEAELAEASTPLLRTGSAPLAWWVIRQTELRASRPGRTLHDTYAIATIQARLQEDALADLLLRLGAASLQPILGKGWVAAGLYPEPGLRPFGDFDFYVRPADVAAVRNALAGAMNVDLHRGLAQLDDRSETVVEARSRPKVLRGLDVRVFSAEDHLRLLCLHFLGHGASRPAWLCDVGAALETRPVDLDWDYLLSGNPRRTDWVVCTLVLAHELLEASLEGVPERISARRLPRWLVPAVLRRWGARGFVAHGLRVPLARHLRHPLALFGALRARWPNEIEASVGVRAPFNALPRFPIRLAESIRRSVRFGARLLRADPEA